MVFELQERGFAKVELHVDSSVVVCTLDTTKVESVVGWHLIQEICWLLALEWKVKIYHSYREANSCLIQIGEKSKI